jgi:tetratricopeptide (TPR) repeat protein
MPPENDVQAEIEQLEQRFAENSKGLVFAHLADAYRRAGQYAKAEGLILHGLKHHPSYTTAYNVLGRVYLDNERFADAHQQFSKVLELDPHNLIALRALGDLAVRGGRLDDARVWYERMLQVDPRNEEAKDELRKLEAGIAGVPPAAVAETPAAAELGEPAPEIAEGDVELAELQAPEVEPSPEEVAAIPEADVPESPPWEAAPEAALAESTPSAEAEEASAPTAGAEPDEVAAEPRPEGPAHEPTMELSPPESLEFELGDLEDWAPGFLRDEDLEGEGEALAPDVLFAEAGGDLGPDEGDASRPGEADEVGGAVVTETMAELYAEQGLYEDAIDVYRQLIEIRPNDERLWTRVAELQKLAETAAAGDTGEEVAELSELTEPAAAEPSELPDAGPQVAATSAERGFRFDDEAPVAGIEQLDPFAASFDVLAMRAERATPPAPEVPFERLAEVSEPEPVAPEEPEAVALEELREEVALEALQETPLSADVLPPGEEFTVPVEVETPMPPPASLEPAVGVGQVAEARTIEDYLAGLLAFNPEAATVARSEGAAGTVDAASSADAPTSEDMEQFQAWLRSLKR